MFESYDIKIITKTVNNITDIDSDGTIEYSTTHNNEGIAEIRIFDAENDYMFVASKIFEPAIQEQKEAYTWIKEAIENFESIPLDKQKLIDAFLAAKENGSYDAGVMNQYEQAGMYLHNGTPFEWDAKWMDKYEDWWTVVKTLVEIHQQ